MAANRKRGPTTRPKDNSAPTKDNLRKFAIDRFEAESGIRWTDALEAGLRTRVGEPADHRAWNADRAAATRLRVALERFLAHARKGETDPSSDTSLRRWARSEASHPQRGEVTAQGEHAHSIHHLLFWLSVKAPDRKRRASKNVLVWRFLQVSNFLNLGRYPKEAEMVALWILVGEGTKAKCETVGKYWDDVRRAIRKLAKKHPKTASAASRTDRNWPPTEAIGDLT